MSENKLQTVTVLRRINLGNYQHYELEVTIHDKNEFTAMSRALILMAKTFVALGLNETIDISKIKEAQ